MIIRVHEDIAFVAGRLGTVDLKAGIYVYTGSGMRNLRQRIARHQIKDKIQKWHIDYLLAQEKAELIRFIPYYSSTRQECSLNLSLLEISGAFVPVTGFGSSDCRRCPAHLIGFKGNVEIEIFL